MKVGFVDGSVEDDADQCIPVGGDMVAADVGWDAENVFGLDPDDGHGIQGIGEVGVMEIFVGNDSRLQFMELRHLWKTKAARIITKKV